MDFYNLIYNAMYSHVKEMDIDFTGRDWNDIVGELNEKYLKLVEMPLTDGIYDAVVEKYHDS